MRFVYNFPEVTCVLSGVSTMEQLQDNIRIFENAQPDVMTKQDLAMIDSVREAYNKLIKVPCTGCSYCVPCPKGINIPRIFYLYNSGSMYGDSAMYKEMQRLYGFVQAANADATQCVGCGACEKKCPQHIHIIDTLPKAHETLINAGK